MNEQQQRQLLDEVQRQSKTLGKEIPDELTVQGTTVDLKAFVFECKRLDTIPPKERDRVEELKRQLKRERLERKQRLSDGKVSYEKGEQLVRSIHGIDRAVNALESLDEPDIGEQLRQKQIDDAKEVLTLLRQARG